MHTENSASRPSLAFSPSSSSFNTKLSRYWSAISWYSASEICAALPVFACGSVFGGSGSELSGARPLNVVGVVENWRAAESCVVEATISRECSAGTVMGR